MHIFDSRNPYSVIFVLGITVIILLGGWFIGDASSRAVFVEEQVSLIKSNQKIWDESEPASYSYSIWYGCMLSDISNVKITDGIKSFGEKEKGITIDDLFKVALKIVSKASSYQFKYNNNFGYPEHIKVDWNSETYDDECFYQVQDFSVSG